MAKVIIHAVITLDGYMADKNGSIDWMNYYGEQDSGVIAEFIKEIGAVIGGSNKTKTIEDGEEPYGGELKVPVYEMVHEPQAPVVKNGTTYTFVVNDIAKAVELAKADAGDKSVILLGGTIARQCLKLGLVDEIQIHVVPMLLGEGIPLFAGLGQRVNLEPISANMTTNVHDLRYRVLK